MRIERLPISVLRTRYVPGGWDLLAFVLVFAFFVYVAQAAHGLVGSLARLQATPISLAPTAPAKSVSPAVARANRPVRAPPARHTRRRQTPARRRAGPSRRARSGFGEPRSAAARCASGEVCPNEVTIGTVLPARRRAPHPLPSTRRAKHRATVVRYFVMKANLLQAAMAATLALAWAAATHGESPPASDTK